MRVNENISHKSQVWILGIWFDSVVEWEYILKIKTNIMFEVYKKLLFTGVSYVAPEAPSASEQVDTENPFDGDAESDLKVLQSYLKEGNSVGTLDWTEAKKSKKQQIAAQNTNDEEEDT